jgi:hypothetical protein
MKKKDIWISSAIIAAAGLTLLLYTKREGFVGIDAGDANATLRLRSNWFGHKTITSGAEPAAIGARVYRPQFLSLSMRQDGQTWKIESFGPWEDLSKIKVRNNEATTIRLGPPFLIRPKVNKNSSILSIGYAIIGQAGEQYENSITKDSQAVIGATISIINEGGNILESGKFKYG